MHYLISLLLVFSLTAEQESKNKEKDIFSQVPTQSRASLEKRLRLYIKYVRQQEHGKLYEMFSEDTKNPRTVEARAEYPFRAKDTFVQFYKSFYPKVLNFKPHSLVKESFLGDYKIRGEATLRDKNGHKSKEERVLFVRLENGDWYFSEFMEEMVERLSR